MVFQWQRIAMFVFFIASKLLDRKLLLKMNMEGCTVRCRRKVKR